MYIKTIVLEGFKSYAKRTEVKDFDKTFNAITGLNGTGKSNILDSICFVLGITSLNQVRVNSLQDLIYKSGQAGVTKATVSIIFDNSDKDRSPPGYEEHKELVVSRQVIMGGKNKYMINGATVQNKRVQDLFCSIQLNVNNPHFLIMQGRVTKVLNMKPIEILTMIEEAAGIRMYELKRETVLKTIKKKEEKLQEINAIINEEIKPKLDKVREERAIFLELNRIKQSAQNMQQLHKCYLIYHSKKGCHIAEMQLKEALDEIEEINSNVENNNVKIKEIESEIENFCGQEIESKLKELSHEVKESEKEQSKEAAAEKGAKENINGEGKKLKELKKNLDDDEKTLKSKENELAKMQGLYEELQNKSLTDKAAYVGCQNKYEALIAGMEINDEGQAETLLEQLTNARGNMSKATTTIKQAELQLQHRRTQIKEKEKMLNSHKSEYSNTKQTYDKINKELIILEKELNKINYSEEQMNELRDSNHVLKQDIRGLQQYTQNFSARFPLANFQYTDPEPNFDRSKVLGSVYTLFEPTKNEYFMALETAAGSRLLNVVVDTSETSKKLLEKGNLKVRTTIIPLNKIQAGSTAARVINQAQQLVGAENVQTALSLIKYDNKKCGGKLSKVMEFVFGDVLVCKDVNCATKLAFHDSIRKKCVTLAGDVIDPSGVLSGGAAPKDGSLLLKLKEFQSKESEMRSKLEDVSHIESKIQKLTNNYNIWRNCKEQFDIKQQELQFQKRQLELTKHFELQEEIKNFNNIIVELENEVKISQENVKKNSEKIKELEDKLKDSDGYKKKELKRVEAEMKKLKLQSDKSEADLKQYKQDFEVMNLEISEIKKGIENTNEQITACEEVIENLEKAHEEQYKILQEKKEHVMKLKKEFEHEKALISEKNKAIQGKNNVKEQLLAEISEFDLQKKKKMHNVKKLQDEFNKAKAREAEYSKNYNSMDPMTMKKAEELSDEEGRKLENQLKSCQEKIKTLSRNVNPVAQNMLENEEKRHNDLIKKKLIVESDKQKLLQTIEKLDKDKMNILQGAVKQISKDFGSIFSTLLPGSNCTLQPLLGKTIAQGIEIKVCLGNIWKESLTELSGGQRSLVALSLILSMLLFKPAPFYILDEIDAALDMSHTQNIGLMIKKHFNQSQFIIVSLKDDMFTNANVLFKTAFIDGASAIQRVQTVHSRK